MATVRESHHYFNNLLQGGLEDRLLHFWYMAVPLEACAVIMNSILIQETFWYIIANVSF